MFITNSVPGITCTQNNRFICAIHNQQSYREECLPCYRVRCNIISLLVLKYFIQLPPYNSGPGSSVSIETELRAGRSGIESRWGRDFPPVQTGPGVHPASCKTGTGSFQGVKCGGGVLLTTCLSSATVMEE